MSDPDWRLNMQFTAEELPALQELLSRALNCWDPRDVPKWAYELDAKVVAKINDFKAAGDPIKHYWEK